ncbi:AlkZ family DNA glycosylase [Leucobacter sp. UCMA 4100]|uniref:winged helix DNA-binding domain-containing protein n=1 Tax=Leucobacter sp. UCMA 4100 TaxID=2810534 RepID=UPI0022EB7803|nr:winged helix DNA-binding domain-containing protein [Leucobacter sp. UCMA 4100]MDA3147320.1 AlkZ family DNA glycosylase [Leucobacter sp. UCMA 4100]
MHTATAASPTDVLNWRMRGLLLARAAATAPSNTPTPAQVVQHLTALQGQDWYASLWAVGVRSGATRAAVHDALANGEVVRSWPMRGTVHLVPAEDLRWVQLLTEKKVLAGVQRRREFLGLDEPTVTRVIDATGAALTGGRALSRADLAEVWAAAGVETPGNWRYHLLWFMSQTGIIVQGPLAAPGTLGRVAEPLFTLADEWITAPRTLSGDEALTELATRFTRGRGVVQEQDFAWWAGLGKRDTAKAFAGAAREASLVPLEVLGERFWGDPLLIDSSAQANGETLLLPAFDEHLLGFTDRGLQLGSGHLAHVVPGNNGMFRPTVVRDGRTVATWKAKQLATKASIEITTLPGEHVDAAEVATAARAWATFHEAPEPEVSVS